MHKRVLFCLAAAAEVRSFFMVRKFCLFRKFFGKFTPKKAKKSTNSFFMVGVKKKKFTTVPFVVNFASKFTTKQNGVNFQSFP